MCQGHMYDIYNAGKRSTLQDDRYCSIGNKGICAIDLGGDRGKQYDKFLEKKKEKRFVIRKRKKS